FLPPLLLLPSSPLQRFIHPKYSDIAGKKDRLIAWKAGLRMVEAHPVTGIGVGEFKPQMQRYADRGVGFSSIAHNTYLEVAAETGLPTFAVFLALVFLTYRGFGKARRRTAESGPPLVHMAALGLQAGFVGYVVGAFFLSAEYQKMFWMWIFLSMCMAYFSSMPAPESGPGSRYDRPPSQKFNIHRKPAYLPGQREKVQVVGQEPVLHRVPLGKVT
ncbi:MAG TPA: O-antigen ligase family protein, partial [Terriglobales bacterium]|nr:O-antigen ligase family protein [Terriglobales bacterium]